MVLVGMSNKNSVDPFNSILKRRNLKSGPMSIRIFEPSPLSINALDLSLLSLGSSDLHTSHLQPGTVDPARSACTQKCHFMHVRFASPAACPLFYLMEPFKDLFLETEAA